MSEEEKNIEALRQELEKVQAEYDDFVYIVSHDLMGPFRHIEGFSNFIWRDYEDQFDDKAKRNFQSVFKATERGKEIIEGLLKFSRLRNASEAKTIDLNAIITEAKTVLATEHMFDCQSEDLPEIKGDERLIYELFYELLKNAVTYVDEGVKPSITITATQSEESVEVTILDNGIAVPATLHEKIFKPLRRAVGEDYPGVGMGLTLALKIAELHGGTVRYENLESGGSSVAVSLSRG